MKNTITFWKGLLLLMLLVGCSVTKNVNSRTQEDILSGVWEMEKWSNYETIALAFPRELPFLVFNTESLLLNGSNSCNIFSGRFRYDLNQASIQLYGIASSKMFCETVPENEFYEALTSVTNYRVTNKKLILFEGDKEVMVLNRKKDK